MKNNNILLVGPFGGCNFGDDLILDSLKTFLEPSGFSVKYTKIGCMDNNDNQLSFPNLRKIRFGALLHVNKFDQIIICGGQQLQEPRLPNIFWGHLANIFHFCLISKVFKKKFYVLGTGCDHSFSILGKLMLKFIERNSNEIMLRDEASLCNYNKVNKTSQKSKLIYDLVFLNNFQVSNNHSKFKIIIFISFDLKNIKNREFKYKHLSNIIKYINNQGLSPLICFSDTQQNVDYSFFKDCNKFLSSNLIYSVINPYIYSKTIFLSLIKNSEIIISYRMHPLILGMCNYKKVIPIITCEKINSLVKRFEVKGSIIYKEGSNNVSCDFSFVKDSNYNIILLNKAQSELRSILTKLI